MTATPLHHAFVAFLILVFPIWDRAETKRLKTSTDPNVRRDSYLKTIIWQILASAFLLATIPFETLYTAPPDARAILPDGRMLIPIMIALAVGMLAPMIIMKLQPEKAGAHAKQLEAVSFFLPRGTREKQVFALMCLTVGVCEELIFRGFLIRYLHALPFGFSWTGAIAGAALIFGIDHGYQGWIGILTTAGLAILFSFLFLMSGTLLLPMAVHVVMDLRILGLWREAE